MESPNYGVAQWLLYQTNRLITENCRRNLLKFQEFSASYTEAMLDELDAQNDAAEALKNEEQRAQEHKQLREELLPIFKTNQFKMQLLKRYIEKAFAKAFWDMNFKSAGLDKYNTDMNFAEARNMYVEAKKYLVENSDALKANENMPDTFNAQFIANTALFNAKLLAFENAETAAVEGTDAKIAANNAIYSLIQVICQDGQAIFMENSTLKGEFSFEKVSQLIRPIGPAGLKGKVIYLIDGKPVVGAIGEIEGTNHTAVTDTVGEYDFGSNLASGTFKMRWKLNDEVIAEEDVVIPAGVTVRETVEVEVPEEPVV